MAGFGKAAAEKLALKQVSEFHLNEDINDAARTFAEAYLVKYNRSWYADRYRWLMAMFAAAANKAGSVDPVAVGKAMEGLAFDGPVGTVTMRAEDHQIQMPMIVSEVSDKAKVPFIYDGKDFGFAWATKSAIAADVVGQPTTCKMKRP
jgi:branched-chain amino acid transport system substrate-binding protein